jgi:hypothetical protein
VVTPDGRFDDPRAPPSHQAPPDPGVRLGGGGSDRGLRPCAAGRAARHGGPQARRRCRGGPRDSDLAACPVHEAAAGGCAPRDARPRRDTWALPAWAAAWDDEAGGTPGIPAAIRCSDVVDATGSPRPLARAHSPAASALFARAGAERTARSAAETAHTATSAPAGASHPRDPAAFQPAGEHPP